MPYQKDVPERKWWWCPKWYWPFAVCSGIRLQHKWCYNFSWTTTAEYGLVKHCEGCENGRLYTWSEPTLNISQTTYDNPVGETCFDSSRGSDEGVCDGSNTGMKASQLEYAAPSASSIEWDLTTRTTKLIESGTFDFEGKYETRCRKGAWPWKLSTHEEMISAVVVTHDMVVQWTVAGTPITDASGLLTVVALCSWPMPMPDGRSQNKAVTVRYEVEQNDLKSTLRLYNDPLDGTYTLSFGMRATAVSGEMTSSYTSAAFHGQMLDWDPRQVTDLVRCWTSQIVIPEKPLEFGRPVPDDHVVVFGNEFWRTIPAYKRTMIASLVDVMNLTAVVAPTVFADAMTLIEQQTGIVAVSRLMSIRSGVVTARPAESTDCEFCNQVSSLAKPVAVGVIAVATILVAKRLFGRGKR